MKGYGLAFLAALLWGVSGTLAQYLFQYRAFNFEWLVTFRLIVSGAILLTIPLFTKRAALVAPWKNGRDRIELIVFGIFGMLAVQYTFFVTIKLSNAATATILQYLGPIFIAGYYSFKEKRLPIARDLLALFLAMLGTFLIVTHGSLEGLTISTEAFIWGLLSALALATYSILPVNLLNKYETSVIIGWGMLIGGIGLGFKHSPFDVEGIWDSTSVLLTVLIIIFGTLVAFYSYLTAVKLIGATITSLIACAEPLSAAIIAVFWLNVPFGYYDWLGMFCILFTIGLLAKKS